MERVLLLKTQLAEAARFAKSKNHAHNRLAVILLDNFVEIQLGGLIKQRFILDEGWYKIRKKYTAALRKKILTYHADLLQACVAEKIITPDEERVISFCHSIRNKLYHHGDEDKLLTRIALLLLHDMIHHYQVSWKSTKLSTSYSKNHVDPFLPKGFSIHNANSNDAWIYFLKHHFAFKDHRTKTSQKLLSDYLTIKLREAKEYLEYVDAEHGMHFPGTENWKFDDYLMHYSFFKVKKEEIQNIRTYSSGENARIAFAKLYQSYQKQWRKKSSNRLKTLFKQALSISKLSVAKAVEKYSSLREEVLLIHDALQDAAGVIDQVVDEQIEEMRLKS